MHKLKKKLKKEDPSSLKVKKKIRDFAAKCKIKSAH
jgi:hypothetical protein